MLKLVLVAVISTLMWTICITQSTDSMDYLKMKWKVFYGLVDVNHDGIVSSEDTEETRNNFQAEGVNGAFDQWWNMCIFFNGPVKGISETAFLHKLAYEYNKNKQRFMYGNQHCFNLIFHIFDINKDSSINLNEYIKAFNAFGHDNSEMIKKVFEVHDPPTSGLVPLVDVVSTWVRFMTEEKIESNDGLTGVFMQN